MSFAIGNLVDDERLQQFEMGVMPCKELVSKVESFVAGLDFYGVVKRRSAKVADAQVVRRKFIGD